MAKLEGKTDAGINTVLWNMRRPMTRPEAVVWLIGDRDKIKFLQGTPWQRLGVIEWAMPIPGFSRRGEGPAAASGAQAAGPVGMRRGGAGGPTQVNQSEPRREVTWLVAVKGETPLKIVVSSQKGGTQLREVKVQ